MDKLKKDTLKVGDTFKISYTPRTHNSEIIDVVDESQLTPIFRNATWNDDCEIKKHKTKGHNYIRYFDIMQDSIRCASTELGTAFITLTGKSYTLNKHDNLEDNQDDN